MGQRDDLSGMLEEITPRQAAAVGLLALIPTVVYGVGHPGLAGFVAAVNVVLITAALFVAMSPIEESGGATDGRSTG